jgi:hypothetical protein
VAYSPGLAVIIGISNYVNPKATLAGIVPGFNYFAAWYEAEGRGAIGADAAQLAVEIGLPGRK